jgi:pimeloyl-ACP methyl ester carboxylesterase
MFFRRLDVRDNLLEDNFLVLFRLRLRLRLRLLSVLLMLSLTSCFAPKELIKESELFRQTIINNEEISRHYFEANGDRLFYAAAGDQLKPALVIIHGTPGSWRQFARYMLNEKLRERFYVIVVDRPGWGRSVAGDTQEIISYQRHATIFSAFSVALKSTSQQQPVILMGHSLGSSIAPRVAMDYPSAIDGLLLLAGTLSPELSGLRWYNQAARLPIIAWLIGNDLEKSNLEILALRGEIEAMAPLWSSVKIPTIVVQGMNDVYVYPENADFAEKNFDPKLTEVIRLEHEGHLFPLTRREDVVAWSLCLLDRIANKVSVCSRG